MATQFLDPQWPSAWAPDPERAQPCGQGAGGRRYFRLPQPGPWGASLFVKDFGAGRGARAAARREFAAAAAARRAGAPMVRAWAALEVRGRAWLLSQDCGPQAAWSRARALAAPEALGRAAAALHAAGCAHGDLHVQNALQGPDGGLCWTDLRELRSGADASARALDLGRLYASLVPCPARVLLRFARAYLPADARARARKELARAMAEAGWLRFREHQSNLDRRARRALRGGHPLPWHPQVWRVPELRAQRLALEQQADAAAEPLKLGPRTRVLRVRAGDAHCVLKHFGRTKPLDPRDALGRSKALVNLLAAEGLARRGLPAARPLAAWSRAGSGSWLVLEELPEHRPLHEAVLAVRGRDRAALLHELALLVRHLHLAGVAYRDLKPSNVLVGPWGERRLVLIDHDRNRFGRAALPPELARRDLAALHAGLPPEVRAAERFAALRAYDPRWARRAFWRQHVRPLLEEAAARRHRWQPRRLLGGGA